MSENDDYEYHECCDDDDYNDEGDEEEVITDTPLDFKIRQKIIDLQDQLLKHYQKEIELNDVDKVRYTAMVEVLKAVLQ